MTGLTILTGVIGVTGNTLAGVTALTGPAVPGLALSKESMGSIRSIYARACRLREEDIHA